MRPGSATPEATARYAARFSSHIEFYRQAQGLTVSSLGLGTYLGQMTAAADAAYTGAVLAAIGSGINFIDTSLNYRHQLSERAIGSALQQTSAAREELVICTKAGYLVPDAVPLGVLRATDLVGNMHSIAPAFLEDQIERSRQNLGIETIDVFYLHNPETQLRYISEDEFYSRMRAAFVCCEQLAAQGRIGFYGTATWDGYRRNGMPDGLSLLRLAGIAREVAGEAHRFRFIQLPFNLGMTEAHGQRAESLDGERTSVLEAARRLGITVVASASLLQARLAQGLPDQLVAALPGLDNDAGRAIQFARSAPGISVALVGMGQEQHVRENLQVARIAPLGEADFGSLFSR